MSSGISTVVYRSFGIRAIFFGYFVEIQGIYIDRAENPKTLIMGNKSVNKPHAPVEVRFSQRKQQVADINRNVNLLIVALSNKRWIFGEDGGSNVKEKLERGSKDIGETRN